MARQRKIPKDGVTVSGKLHKPHPKLSRRSGNKHNIVFLILAFLAIVLVTANIVYFGNKYYMEGLVSTPLDVPKVIARRGLDIPDRYWGSYRSGAYFGLKTRHPRSLVVGMMWFAQHVVDNKLQIRHWCNQGDSLKRYGWMEHDGTNFGVQEIVDGDVTLTTSFVKRLGGRYGGDWTARITVNAEVKNGSAVPVSLLFYTATDGDGIIQPSVEDEGRLVSITGATEGLGNFEMHFLPARSEENIRYNFLHTRVQPGLEFLKEVVLQNLVRMKLKSNSQVFGLAGHSFSAEDSEQTGNFIVHQVTGTPPFEIEVVFESASMPGRSTRVQRELYDALLKKYRANFEAKFARTFQLQEKDFDRSAIKTAQATLSNMMGGIGYFYGSSLVQSIHNKEPIDYWPAELYTGVPSRSFFPRGFLWDEGFHNLLISRWDADISKDIVGHWFDLLNSEGWIPREQILGAEARARVPKEFVLQRNNNANPPTLLLTVASLVKRMEKEEIDMDRAFLQRLFPRLQIWLEWFNKTQAGSIPGTYYWKGRDAKTARELNPRTLMSGLDDYPRASHPTEDERHVDLRCWMAYAANVMSWVAAVIDKKAENYEQHFKYLADNRLLEEQHWSDQLERFADYGMHSKNVKLVRPKPPAVPPGQPVPKMEKVRAIADDPELRYIDAFGYVSLFPFMLQLLNSDNPKLGKIIADIKNPNLLWTDHGLRSLAKTSPLYMKYNTEHDPPYWRGSIWMNMNYLVLRALHHYSGLPGPYQNEAFAVYKELRINLVSNILGEYKRTGYLWEHYNDKTGEGKGSHPFTGWSALFVLIMGELY